MTWQIVGDTFTLFGTGPVPRIVSAGEPVPPPNLPPPLPPAPPVDDSPFVWPPQPSGHYDPGERYQALNDGAYAGEQEFANPLPGSHRYAGTIQIHVKVATWDLFGWRLWVLAETPPAVIRRLLATGR